MMLVIQKQPIIEKQSKDHIHFQIDISKQIHKNRKKKLHGASLSYVSTIGSWLEDAPRKIPKDQKHSFNGTVIYIMSKIWKECNECIFDNMFQMAQQLALKVKKDISQRKRAFDNPL